MAKIKISNVNDDLKKIARPSLNKVKYLCYLSLVLNIISIVLHYIK